MEILNIKNLKKVYTSKNKGGRVEALRDISFSANEGEFIAIMGESGSGKTTLLNILAALDAKTSGEVILAGKNLSLEKEKNLAKFRREKLGFVFQEFNLLNTLTVKENIILPLVLSGAMPYTIQTALSEVTQKLKITDILAKYPFEISGGQQQRAAVARAIITKPALLLADEPTGALDSKSTDTLLNEFKNINSGNQTVIMVTHSVRCASVAKRVLFIKDGVIFHELYKGDVTEKDFFIKISDALTALQNGGDDYE